MNKTIITLVATTLFSHLVLAEAELPDKQAELPTYAKTKKSEHLVPRDFSTIADTPFGDKVKQGYSLFVNTQTLQGKYVNNQQNCVNCHMQAGKKADSAPLWAAFMAYPTYRSKNDKVNTYAERIQGCFTYSMNGTAPPPDSLELVALSAYSYWLAMGGLLDKYGMEETPVPELSDTEIQIGGNDQTFILPDAMLDDLPAGKRGILAGRGFPKLDKPAQSPSIERGEVVYNSTCASCHGVNGEGIKDNGIQSFPPLWGDESFNWGAGMHRINTAAFFIYENMPLGKSIQITKQQAWDVAAFMNSHERPQDPRFKGDVKELKRNIISIKATMENP